MSEDEPRRRARHRQLADIAAEIWETQVYHGRRRVEDQPLETPAKRRLAIVAVVVALAAAILLPLALLSTGDPALVVPPTFPPLTALTSDALPTGETPGPGPTTRPPTPTPKPTPTATARTRPPFGPVTYQAESDANRLSGSAWVVTYPGASGGELVRNIGDWGRGRDGTLRFNGVTVPFAGSYALTFFYVHVDGERIRTLTVTVSGRQPVTLEVAGSGTCCARQTIRVTLAQGSNSITFTNPTGPAPSIDRIMIAA